MKQVCLRRSGLVAQLFPCLLLAALVAGVAARGDDFNSRRTAFLNYYDTAVPNTGQCCSGPHRIGRTGFWAAEGRFLNNDLINGSNYMYAAVGDANSEGSNAGFSMWPAMDCYLRWSAALPSVFTPTIANYFKSELTTDPATTNYSSGATANQRMMLTTAHYLAGSVWGTNAFLSGSQYQTDYGTGDPTGKAYVSNTIVSIPRYGLLEHDSPIYAQFTLGPIYTLEQFAPDAVLRNKARLAFDWAVAEIAGYYSYNNWAIASDRTEPYWVQSDPSETTMMSYLFFGGPTPRSLLESYPSAPYCMPGFPGILPEVVMAATNRTRSYTHYSTAMRNTGGYNNGYFKTSYITPGYAIYSQAECGVATNADGSLAIGSYGTVSLSDPHQMQRWGVIWNAPNDQTKFWITNPYNPVYSGSYPNTYIGTTISEETVQLGGTLAAVYNIPTNATKPDWNHNGAAMTNYQLLEGQVPTNYTALIDNSTTSGRLFLHYTNVLIALYISTNFTWVADTDTTNYFQIPANIMGLAVETASPNEYTQSTASLRLAAFRNDVLTSSSANTNLLTGANPTMVYTDRHSNVLQITFGQGSKTNGQSVDYQQWPAISNPWMFQAQLGSLFIFGTNRTIIYNFNDWTETTNNQPTLLTSAPVTATQNDFMDIDLRARISDAETPTSNLLFTVSNPTNGTITLLADSHTARFTPATNYAGPAGFAFTTTDVGLDPRLVLYYNFEPPNTLSANSISDASGNARPATVATAGTGAAAYDPEVPAVLRPFSSQSLRLTESGANAARLTRTVNVGNLSLTNGSWTFATWFQRSTQTNDDFILYIGNGDGFGGNGDELQLYCLANANTLALSHWTNSATTVQDLALAPTNSLGAGQWHHVAVVFERVADALGTVRLYLDGALAATAGNVAWALKQDYPMVFGGSGSNTSKVYRWFNGSFDELALFRGALSTAEIARLATCTVAHFGGFTVTNSVAVSVTIPPNTAPILAALSNRTVNTGVTLILTNTATDADAPPQTLAFTLLAAPPGATLATNTGVLVWRPNVSQADNTYQFTVRVSDDGSPSLSATQSLLVTVPPFHRPNLAQPVPMNAQLDLQILGDSGPDYTVQASTNLALWTDLFTTNAPALPFTWGDTNFQAFPRRFYRVLLRPW